MLALTHGPSVGPGVFVPANDPVRRHHDDVRQRRQTATSARIADEMFSVAVVLYVLANTFLPDGAPLPEGTILRNPAYAAFLGRLATEGPSALYAGSTAARIVARTRAGPLGGGRAAQVLVHQAAWRRAGGMDMGPLAAMAKYYRAQDKRVGIIAVDPTSPFTGGAILGDRIRMAELYTDRGVFIRSMATRGFLGGLAKATNDVKRNRSDVSPDIG